MQSDIKSDDKSKRYKRQNADECEYMYKQKSYINKLVKDNQRNVEAISQGKDDHEDMSAQSDECDPVNNLNLWCKCIKNMDSVCVCIQALEI